MKRIIITNVLCLVSVISLAQERINRPKLHFISEGISMSEFKGWSYDDRIGEWFDCNNVILNEKKYSDYAKLPDWKSHYFNNIKSLQFKTIICNHESYYVLIWEKWEGAYDYPEIWEDWKSWQTKVFLMINEENMDKLKYLTNKPIIIKVPAPVRNRNDKDVEDVDVIQNAMNKINEYINEATIEIYKSTDGHIRFLFINNGVTEKGIWYQYNINKSYFEINESSYMELLNISF